MNTGGKPISECRLLSDYIGHLPNVKTCCSASKMSTFAAATIGTSQFVTIAEKTNWSVSLEGCLHQVQNPVVWGIIV